MTIIVIMLFLRLRMMTMQRATLCQATTCRELPGQLQFHRTSGLKCSSQFIQTYTWKWLSPVHLMFLPRLMYLSQSLDENWISQHDDVLRWHLGAPSKQIVILLYIIMVPNLLASTRGCILFPIACGLYGSWARSGGAVVWAGWTMLDNQNVTLTAGPQSPGYCRPLCASGSFEWLGKNWDLRTVGFMVGPEKNFMNYSRFLWVYKCRTIYVDIRFAGIGL